MMQKLENMNLMGILRPETFTPNAVNAEPMKVAQNPAQTPMQPLGARTLTLAQAQQITSAALGTSPDRRVPTVQRPSARVTSTGVRRIPPRLAADPFSVATEVPPQAKRDAEGAVLITEKQAAGYLPDGRYRVHANGRILRTIEIGGAWCAEGLRLVRTRKGTEAAQRRIEKEKVIQDDLFGEIRC
jgi:hypothetical protein